MSLMHTKFKDITIHTAKCDTCNKHNTKIMKQCVDCGQNFCTPCWQARGSDGTHMLNSGDKGYAATKAQMTANAGRARPLDLLKPKKEKVSSMKSPSPRTAGRSKRVRRRTVVIEESESEDDGFNENQMVVDETTSDEADEKEQQLTLEPPPKMSKVRGKQHNILLPTKPKTAKFRKPARSPSPAVRQPAFDSSMEENDAANSLLELRAGSHGVALNNFTPINTGNNTGVGVPRIDVSEYGTGSFCETIYSPNSPSRLISGMDSSNQQYWSAAPQPSFGLSTNGTDLPVSMQVHPYPAKPEVTSRVIGHDSLGGSTLNPPQPLRTPAKTKNAIIDLTNTSDNIIEQDAKVHEPLFVDYDEAISAISAENPKESVWSAGPATGTTGWTDDQLQDVLSSLTPEVLEKAFGDMVDGMDDRGERLFGNDAYGQVWDEQFDEPYLSGHHADEHHAGAKANLDVGSEHRARRIRVVGEDEDLEDGEIRDDEDMSSG